MREGIFDRMLVNIYEVPEEKKAEADRIRSTVADEGLYGQRFVVIGSAVGFWKIRTSYNYEGYVKRDEVLLCDSVVDHAYGGYLQVIKGFADILEEPFVAAVRLLTVTRGALLIGKKTENNKEINQIPDGYIPVRLYDGREGYIKSSCVEKYREPLSEEQVKELDESAFRRRLVCTAMLYLGTRYRWGGKTPLGIDCSGLTSMSYLLNGVVIYRDARLVPGFPVHEIPYRCKKPGDLLYFPGHIAMYIGNDEYIHSTARPGSDGVVLNSLNPRAEGFRHDLAEGLYAVGSIF